MSRRASSLEDLQRGRSKKSLNLPPVSCFPNSPTVISAREAGGFLEGLESLQLRAEGENDRGMMSGFEVLALRIEYRPHILSVIADS